MELVEEYTRVIKIEEGYPHAKTLYLPTGEIDAVVDWCKHGMSSTVSSHLCIDS